MGAQPRKRPAPSVLKRFGILYVLGSVFLTTLIVVLVAVNLVALVFQSFGDRKRSDIAEASKDARQAVYADFSREDMEQLLDETWKRPYVFAPWVGFREEPREGRYVTVREDGYRACAETERPLDSDGFHIYFFGGSTSFGYGVADCETIPYYLQELLRERRPELDPVVFNFGRGWYYSSQELVLLLTLLRDGHTPDAVVFFDGFNEGQGEPHYTEEMTALFHRHNEKDAWQQVREALGVLPVASFWTSVTSQGPASRYYMMKSPEDIITNWLATRRIVQQLADTYGFTPFFFVQPIPGYKNDFLHHKYRSERYVEHFEHVMEKIQLMEESVDGQTSFSMTHLLEGWPEQPFVDDVHYTPKVNAMLAGFMAEKLTLGE